LRVTNTLGIHARPAAVIVKLLQGVRSDVSISYKQETINAKSIMGILMLGIKENSDVLLTIEGEDAEEVFEKLQGAFNDEFGEKAR
jgi:phosphocarrier protein HPr